MKLFFCIKSYLSIFRYIKRKRKVHKMLFLNQSVQSLSGKYIHLSLSLADKLVESWSWLYIYIRGTYSPLDFFWLILFIKLSEAHETQRRKKWVTGMQIQTKFGRLTRVFWWHPISPVSLSLLSWLTLPLTKRCLFRMDPVLILIKTNIYQVIYIFCFQILYSFSLVF